VADVNFNALGDQLIGGHGGIHIGSGNIHAHTLEHKAQRPHGNAADAHQMDMGAGYQIVFKFLASVIHKSVEPPEKIIIALTFILYSIFLRNTTIILPK
jgi:hypothetical protein